MKTELKNVVGRILLTSLTMTATVNLKHIISQQLSDVGCVAEVPVSNGIKYASSIFYSGFIQKVINTILQESTCARVSLAKLRVWGLWPIERLHWLFFTLVSFCAPRKQQETTEIYDVFRVIERDH